MMTVGELKRRIAELPDDAEVVCSYKGNGVGQNEYGLEIRTCSEWKKNEERFHIELFQEVLR